MNAYFAFKHIGNRTRISSIDGITFTSIGHLNFFKIKVIMSFIRVTHRRPILSFMSGYYIDHTRALRFLKVYHYLFSLKARGYVCPYRYIFLS